MSTREKTFIMQNTVTVNNERIINDEVIVLQKDNSMRTFQKQQKFVDHVQQQQQNEQELDQTADLNKDDLSLYHSISGENDLIDEDIIYDLEKDQLVNGEAIMNNQDDGCNVVDVDDDEDNINGGVQHHSNHSSNFNNTFPAAQRQSKSPIKNALRSPPVTNMAADDNDMNGYHSNENGDQIDVDNQIEIVNQQRPKQMNIDNDYMALLANMDNDYNLRSCNRSPRKSIYQFDPLFQGDTMNGSETIVISKSPAKQQQALRSPVKNLFTPPPPQSAAAAAAIQQQQQQQQQIPSSPANVTVPSQQAYNNVDTSMLISFSTPARPLNVEQYHSNNNRTQTLNYNGNTSNSNINIINNTGNRVSTGLAAFGGHLMSPVQASNHNSFNSDHNVTVKHNTFEFDGHNQSNPDNNDAQQTSAVEQQQKQLEQECENLRCEIERLSVNCDNYQKIIGLMNLTFKEQKEIFELKLLSFDSERQELTEKLSNALEDAVGVEGSFSELHRRYERVKLEFEATKQRFVNERHEFEMKLNEKNFELEQYRKELEENALSGNAVVDEIKKKDREIMLLRTQLKKSELKIAGLQAQVEHKNQENAELNEMVNELTKLGC